MTVSVSSSPPYPATGQSTVLIGTSDLYDDSDVEWELTSVPAASRLPLGPLLERAAKVPRTSAIPFTFNAGDAARGKSATITRPAGTFVGEGYEVGMVLVLNGTLNRKRVTAFKVSPQEIRLAPDDTLETETVTGALTAAFDNTGGPPTNIFVPDVPGAYGVTALEYFNFPRNGTHALKSKATATIHVGSYLSLPIEPVNGHGSTLRILVVGSTVRRAELVDPKTELARVAALDATVAAAVTALEGVAVGSIDVDFVTDVNDLSTAYEAHRVLVGGFSNVHVSADTTNAMLREPANSVPAAIVRLNELAVRLAAHREATSSGGAWHQFDDGKNTLQVAPSAQTLAQAIVLKADLRERSYERHRVLVASPASHPTADATNFLTDPRELPAAIVAYLDFIANATPTVAASEAQGIATAAAAWGFRA